MKLKATLTIVINTCNQFLQSWNPFRSKKNKAKAVRLKNIAHLLQANLTNDNLYQVKEVLAFLKAAIQEDNDWSLLASSLFSEIKANFERQENFTDYLNSAEIFYLEEREEGEEQDPIYFSDYLELLVKKYNCQESVQKYLQAIQDENKYAQLVSGLNQEEKPAENDVEVFAAELEEFNRLVHSVESNGFNGQDALTVAKHLLDKQPRNYPPVVQQYNAVQSRAQRAAPGPGVASDENRIRNNLK